MTTRHASAPLSAGEVDELRRFLESDRDLQRGVTRDPLLARVVEQCQRLLATLDDQARTHDESRSQVQEMRQSLLQHDMPPPGLLGGPRR